MYTKLIKKIAKLQRNMSTGHCIGGIPSPFGHCY